MLNNVSEPDRPSLGFRSFHQALGRQALARETETAAQRAGAGHLPGAAKRPQEDDQEMNDQQRRK